MRSKDLDLNDESRKYCLKIAVGLAAPWVIAAAFPRILGYLAMGLSYAFAKTMKATPLLGMAIGMTIPSWTAVAIAASLAAILALISRRLWALRLPMLLAAAVACLLLSDLMALRGVILSNFSGSWWSVLPGTDIGSLLSLASRGAWTVCGIAAGLAIMRPVTNWSSSPASKTFVAITAFAGAESYIAMMWRMATPGMQYPTSHWNALLGSSMAFTFLPIALGAGAMAAAIWQRSSTSTDGTAARRAQWRLRRPVLIGTAIGLAISLATLWPSMDKAGWSFFAAIVLVLKGFETGLIYIIPCVAITLALSFGERSKAAWALCITATLVPFAMWAIERSSTERAESRSKGAAAIAWQDATGHGKALLLPTHSGQGYRIIKDRGLGRVYIKTMDRSQWRTVGIASYQTGSGSKKETFEPGGDYIEVTDVKSDKVGYHVPRSYEEAGTIYVYIGENGTRRLAGEVPYSSPYSKPQFPPMLNENGTWRGAEANGRSSTSKERIVDRILQEIPM